MPTAKKSFSQGYLKQNDEAMGLFA